MNALLIDESASGRLADALDELSGLGVRSAPTTSYEEDCDCDPFRLLGRMAAGVAHDLNNYMAVLRIALDMLERGSGGPIAWDHARGALDAALGLNRSLLEYARGGSPAPAKLDLGDLVRRTLALVSRLIRTEIEVLVETDDALPAIHGVATQLEQLVLNLVLNACDAMPNGGELRISVRAPAASQVVLEVADTGSGVSPTAAGGPRSHSIKAGRHGVGLGLGIVRSVVEGHRGSLCIRPRDGGGTRVTVVLAPAAR